ncbi:unnamed protein product [Ascophyllum nodosum]
MCQPKSHVMNSQKVRIWTDFPTINHPGVVLAPFWFACLFSPLVSFLSCAVLRRVRTIHRTMPRADTYVHRSRASDSSERTGICPHFHGSTT